ncbi:MAG: alpha/beta hydrolase [Muricauda sp.]|nr:alpha/beta hydrolase [Allomuricauda sp.]MBC30363.1 alpha/beta hydrolase [Allomuricauda sp.]|tara:strand:+ start:1093 stop:1935 length:843 start_codon:yes stop_codon:yes gene_type:complete
MKRVKHLLASTIIFLLTMNGNAQNNAFSVRVVGEGEPLLFFPGFICSDEVWEEQVAELSKEYECHLFTFAGFGGVAPIEFPWYPKVEDAVLDYIKENNLENATAIGHSLGGTLALSLASRQPLFKKLVIVDALTATGALMFPNYNPDNMVYDSPYNNQLLEMGQDDFSKMATGMASGMTTNKEKQGQIIEWMEKADRKTYVYGYTDYLKVDLREQVGKIKIPVTILAATQPFGEAMARQTYQEQYKNLSNYELKFAEGAAHFIMYDRPEWFLNELKSSLQ